MENKRVIDNYQNVHILQEICLRLNNMCQMALVQLQAKNKQTLLDNYHILTQYLEDDIYTVFFGQQNKKK